MYLLVYQNAEIDQTNTILAKTSYISIAWVGEENRSMIQIIYAFKIIFELQNNYPTSHCERVVIPSFLYKRLQK